MYRRIFLSLLLLCLFLRAFSQSRNPFFYQIYADYGLSSDKTTRTIQDYMGFLWIGTEEGLNRVTDFGAYDIHKFDRKDTTTISNDHITALFEDKEKRLWVGTRDGLNLYDRPLNRFTRVPIGHEQERSGTINIRHISQDESGDLWVICNDHVVKVSGETFKEELVLEAPDAEGNPLFLTDLTFFKSDVMVGTMSGVYRLSGKELVKTELATDHTVTRLLALGNELWMGTARKGIIRYDATRKTQRTLNEESRQTPLTNNHISDMHPIDGNSVWVATLDGITIVNLETNESQFVKYDFDNAFSLSDRTLRRIYQDRQGVVWITTPNSGINYYHSADNLFDYYGQTEEQGTENDLMDYSVFSLFDHKGSTWLGSRKGLSKFSTAKGTFKHYPFEGALASEINAVLAMDNCRDDNLWMGTNNGLVSWRIKTGTYERILPNVLNGVKVNAVMVDENDNAWLGTENQGVKMYSTVSKMLRDIQVKADGITLDYVPSINVIVKLKNGNILAGSDRGLFAFKEGALDKVSLSLRPEDEADNVPINAIYESDQHGLFIATQQDGLLLLDNELGLKATFSETKGFKSDDVRSIVEDDDGTMWLATNAGLTELRIDHNDTSKTVINNFDISDGLQSNHFSERAGVKNSEGKVLMAGVSGLTVFHPDRIIEYEIPQNLALTSLLVNGEKVKAGEEGSPLPVDISVTDKLILNCEQNDFTITFGANDHIRPGDVEYRYKLVGYHDDWIVQTVDGRASFQNIPGGKDYELLIQSKGRFSDWAGDKKLAIRIEPHFYETVWFKLLVGVAVIGLIALFVWARNKRIVQKRKELEAIVQERSQELTEEITERKKAEEKLKVALTEAEEANEVKSRFLANMSHEIRTPLNGIMGLTQLSLETESKEEQKDILNTLVNSAGSLKVIVDDILDIAKIEAGTMDFVSEVFSIKDLLEEVVASFRTLVEEKNLYLKKWVLPTIPDLVLGDMDRVRQVLINLVSNAIKFTHSGGVTILAEGLDQGDDQIEIWFTVTDTGIGMPETQLNRIFESFTQVDSGDTRAYGGTGLGLSICKELVENMGGEIWAESDENSGSIFRFYIKAEEVFEEDLNYELQEEIPEEIEEEAPSSAKRIILIEDNPTNQKVATKMLERNGIVVDCAENGQIGLHMVKNYRYDLILMDLQMPVMDGYEATRCIKELDDDKARIPIIALTAAAMVGEREKCLAAGMDDYISKPVDYKLLVKTVNEYLDSDLEKETV
ncbi:MAG: response regulator [Roseivirga sp.]|nr:response regulator [Roseivirga sp.]